MENAQPEAITADWLSLGDAIAILEQRLGDTLGAQRTIAEWAAGGILRTEASTARGFFGRPDDLSQCNWKIEEAFWQRVGEHPAIAWRVGNLGLVLEACPGYDVRKHRNRLPARVTGVRVNAVDLKRLIDGLPPVRAISTTGDPTQALDALIAVPADATPIAKERVAPGPKPDPDWDWAVFHVIKSSIDAGYSKALKRGDRAAIETQLLEKMGERKKHPSPDSARKYAVRVINALPDKSDT